MPKIILFTDYIKPNNRTHLVNTINYISKSENVEHNKLNDVADKLSTTRQDNLIRELISLHPNLKSTFEYIEYEIKQTQSNASNFISSAQSVLSESTMTNLKYLEYIAQRPGVVENQKTLHGLFGSSGALDLSTYREKIRNVEGNVFRHVVAIKKEDAEQVGYTHREQWETMLNREMDRVGRVMNFKPGDLEWAAAFHQSDTHPHVHIMMWSKTNDNSIYLKQDGIQKIKGLFGKNIYPEHYQKYYLFKEDIKSTIKHEFEILDFEIESLYKTKTNINILKLKSLIPDDYTGQWKYGFMKEDVKLIIDDMVNDIITHQVEAKNHFDEFVKTELEFLELYGTTKTYEQIKHDFVHPAHSDKKPFHNIMLKKYKDLYFGKKIEPADFFNSKELMKLLASNNFEDDLQGKIFYNFKERKKFAVQANNDTSVYLTEIGKAIDRVIPLSSLNKNFAPATISYNTTVGNVFRIADSDLLVSLEKVAFNGDEISSVTLKNEGGIYMEVLPCDFDLFHLVAENQEIKMENFIFGANRDTLNLLKSLSNFNSSRNNKSPGSRKLQHELEQGAKQDTRVVQPKI